MKSIIPATLTIAASLVFGAQQSTGAVELKMGITAPPGVHISKFFQGWAAKVNKVNPGALTIKVIAGTTLGNVRTIYGNVRNDVANIGWVSTGTVTGKFKKVNVTRLPGL